MPRQQGSHRLRLRRAQLAQHMQRAPQVLYRYLRDGGVLQQYRPRAALQYLHQLRKRLQLLVHVFGQDCRASGDDGSDITASQALGAEPVQYWLHVSLPAEGQQLRGLERNVVHSKGIQARLLHTQRRMQTTHKLLELHTFELSVSLPLRWNCAMHACW